MPLLSRMGFVQTHVHICLCKWLRHYSVIFRAANVASLLGSRGIGSGQMKLTYKGGELQLFFREAVK